MIPSSFTRPNGAHAALANGVCRVSGMVGNDIALHSSEGNRLHVCVCVCVCVLRTRVRVSARVVNNLSRGHWTVIYLAILRILLRYLVHKL